MKHFSLLSVIAAVSAFTLLVGCAGISLRQQNTAAGAGIGAVAGSILTGGSTVGTVGGAAIGGFIGNEAAKKK